MTVTTLQTILITALIATWLVFSIVFLISSIQSFFNDRKREKREEESAARDLKSAMLQEFDKDLFDRYVKRIIVHSRNDIRFELKCGLTLRERK